ncbi:MAG: quinone oxidoreductase [Alphaproteobacteria bacterium]
MSHAVRVHETGDANVMQWEEVNVAAPAAGEACLRHTAIGLNFIDIYFRAGTYPSPQLPFIPGLEAAGVIESIGENVSGFEVGDRVAYASPPLGSYAESRLMPAGRLVKLPGDIDDRVAAAMMLKGMTAHYLLRRTFKVEPGTTLLLHAAAGGVGLIACQWAKYLGATVIGTVGSNEKAELACSHGCDHAILYREEDFVARVREITDGEGVDVVYDSVGKDTFLQSLDCLKPMGMLALFGQSSGAVEPFDLGLLSAKGSLFVTRPTLMNYVDKRSDLEDTAEELFEVIREGVVNADIRQERPLREAATAHSDLESRRTTGATLLIP